MDAIEGEPGSLEWAAKQICSPGNDVVPGISRSFFAIGPFADDELLLRPLVECDALVLRLPGESYFSFSQLRLECKGGTPVGPEHILRVSHPPRHPSNAALPWVGSDIFARGFDGDKAIDAEIVIEFTSKLFIETLAIRNRLGRWGWRILPITITMRNGNEVVYSYENFSELAARRRFGIILGYLLAFPASSDRDECLSLLASLSDHAEEMITPNKATVELIARFQIRITELARNAWRSNPDAAFRLLTLVSDRYPSARTLTTSINLVALAYAIRLMSGSVADYAVQLASWNGLFKDAEGLSYLSSRTASWFKALGGAGTPLISRHGWFVSALSRAPSEFEASLKRLITFLEDSDKSPFISYGTLLGAVRHGDYLPHDDDIDIGILMNAESEDDLRDSLKALADELCSAGFVAQVSKEYLIVQVAVDAAYKQGIDIFPLWRTKDAELLMAREKMQISSIPENLVFPLSKIDFRGSPHPSPGDVEGFLEWRYGSSWKIPDPYYEMEWIFSR